MLFFTGLALEDELLNFYGADEN